MKIFRYLFFILFIMGIVSCTKDDNAPDSTGFHVISNISSSDIDEEYDQDKDSETDKISDTYNYQIPVVFHVVYHNPKDKIEANRIKFILNNVNNLWKGSIFGESPDINVNFVEATHNEKGQKLQTPGVEYIEYETEDSINYKDFMNHNHTDLLWDPNNYVNVFLFPFKKTDQKGVTLGASFLPYTTQNETLEGLSASKKSTLTKNNLSYTHCVVINSIYANSKYDSQRYTDTWKKDSVDRHVNSSTTDISSTLAHELGHYFGLHHVFTEDSTGEAINDCYDTDYCRDTKSYNKKAYDESQVDFIDSLVAVNEKKGDAISISLDDYNKLTNRSNCSGEKFVSNNFLDYAFTNANQFTNEQRKRIRFVLYNSPMIPGPKKNGTNKAKATRAENDVDPDLHPILRK